MERPINKAKNILLVICISFLAAFAALSAYSTTVNFSKRWLITSLAAGLATGVLCYVYRIKNQKVKDLTCLLLFWIIAGETVFQILAFFFLIPGLNVFFFTPFGRLYWTQEGKSNSILNRYSWNYPRADFSKSAGRRVLLIGDSFIEAIQVSNNEHLGVKLENSLNLGDPILKSEVIGLGASGNGPAHYYEYLRLSRNYYDPTDVIVFVYLGNDFRNLLPNTQHTAPGDYIYYELIEKDGLRVHPGSLGNVEYLEKSWKRFHSSFVPELPRTALTHVFSLNIATTIFERIKLKLASAPTSSSNEKSESIHKELIHRGLDDFIFEKKKTENSVISMKMTKLLLQRMKKISDEAGIKLTVVTIPVFPSVFFKEKSIPWSLDYPLHDFLLPEKELTVFCKENDLGIVTLGTIMHEEQIPREKVARMYFEEGLGHFTSEGHTYASDHIYQNLYSGRTPTSVRKNR